MRLLDTLFSFTRAGVVGTPGSALITFNFLMETLLLIFLVALTTILFLAFVSY